MTTQIEFQYEVGFSFLKQDELIAFDLNDHIQNRLSTFIYSKNKKNLEERIRKKIQQSILRRV